MTAIPWTPPQPLPPAIARPRVRVLHVINGEHYAGAERVQDLLALRLPEQGFDVGFVSLKAGRFGDVRRSTEAPLTELAMRSRWDLSVARDIERAVYEGDYQIIHAHTPRAALVASLAARRTATPLVYHVHSPTSRDSTRRVQNWINTRIERYSVADAKRAIVVSPTLVDYARSMGVPADRIACVLNGVPAAQRAAPRLPPTGRWTIGMVALFRPRKGAETMLAALAGLRRQGCDARLRMVGPFETPAYEEKLLALAAELELTGVVDWTGFTDRVDRELASIDLLALPSLFGEGLPMVVLEAMAAGLPIVATRCEGVCEAVSDGRTGLLVEPGDPAALAAAISRITSRELSYAALSAAAIARHAERFSDVAMAQQVAEVYREILG
ncbi:GDP-mannose-dependent alpha-(1-2)-phosphatidylinositol mannosyltransferase [Pirellulimonas nuda]|uniref:GDP-mannose-dependent alpha-(1-2)-phosphatidylinositol mannosyltransferase n=1 Tax=Pirellulimonas nuda TaxID=2528009 RepID=A0A518DIT3_9BACT|nr:glycosyltransferase [Pirellulimonas nuda]QDU91391.1 GDP-mannose-dependent alpha-(1-2)-phosphatidylinositol mannosyltransferase [Pirellulimonas nuda]